MTLQAQIDAYPADEPLSRAHSIPREWYLSSELAERERGAVFARSWQLVARVAELQAPGSYVSVDVAGEPIVLVRDGDTLRGMYNVCRHRGTRILPPGSGTCDRLRCRYHGWTYDLAGQLRGTPDFDGVENFRREDNALPAVQVDTWGPFVFAHLQTPTQSLHQSLAPMIERSAALNIGQLTFARRQSYDIACNWKVFVDNYLDGGYHVNSVHPALAGALDYSGYTTECFTQSSLQSSPLRGSSDVRKGDRAYYWWLFPNTMLNFYEGVLDTNIVLPLGPERCRVHIDFYFAGLAREQMEQSMALGHEIQREDVQISEEVQIGLQSASYSTGRFSVKRERAGYHFHQQLVAALRK